MKKKIIYCLSVLLLLCSCNSGGTSSSNTSISTNSESIISQTNTSNEIIQTPDITQNQALNLIINASNIDLNNAKTSTTNLSIIGFTNGRKYYQGQTFTETTYKNNLTIGSGSINQYFYDSVNDIYSDSFDEVRTIEDNYYIDTRVFKNKVFSDETEMVNLLSFDVSNINEAFSYYAEMVSCGLGLTAYEQFYNSYTLGAEFKYGAKILSDDSIDLYFYGEYFSEDTNQAIVFEYTYKFSSLNEGFLTYYKSEQNFYSYTDYLLTNSFDGLTPTYQAISESNITKGELSDFQGELPIDIHASFVSKVELSATKTEIEVGEMIALKSVVTPETATNKELSFSSSNEGIAKVDKDGRVTGISEGVCTIKATNIASGVYGEITITVKASSIIDPGDDSKKADLKEALDKAYNQIFSVDVFSSTPPSLNKEGSINSISLSTLSISDFSYDENTRIATYVSSNKSRLENIFPFYDNGNENLSNRYLLNRYTMFRAVIISFEIYLSSSNQISYMILECRSDSASVSSGFDIASVNDDNIETTLEFTINPYGTIKTKYVSEGFGSTDEE